MALNRSDKSRILRRYFPGMTRNSEMSTEPSHRGWSRPCRVRRRGDSRLAGGPAWRFPACAGETSHGTPVLSETPSANFGQDMPVPTKAPIKYQTASSGINDLVEEVESGQSSVEEAASKAPLHYGSLVAVEIYVDGDVEQLTEALGANGAALIGVDEGYVEAYVPLPYLGEASALPGVVWMQPIVPPVEEQTPTSQATETPPGPAVEHGAPSWHDAGHTGKGIKVGIIDAGFEGFSGLMGTELPGTVHARCYRYRDIPPLNIQNIPIPLLPHTTNISDCENKKVHGTAVASGGSRPCMPTAYTRLVIGDLPPCCVLSSI